MQTKSDLESIRRVLAGDREAFADLVERYQQRVVATIRRLLADPHASEDVAQDVFLAAFRKLASFDPQRGSFGSWLFSIARNRSLNSLRQRRPDLHAHLDQHPAPIPNGQPDELRQLLDRQLLRLPVAQKSAWVLRHIAELSYAEVARLEGVPEATVRSRVSRAGERLRSALRSRIGEHYET